MTVAETAAMDVSLAADHAFSGFKASLGRVTVVLGANGTGKSELCRRLKSSRAFGTRTLLTVEGGRVITAVGSLADGAGSRSLNTLEEIRTFHASSREQVFGARMRANLTRLKAEDDLLLLEYAESQIQWNRAGRSGPEPAEPERALPRVLHQFSQVFPDVRVAVDRVTKNVSCVRNSRGYLMASLSDGEKQVLCLLSDVAFASPDAAFIIDEPELNLNAGLACDVWSSIEARFPDAIFVYATHCVAFAMRPSVDQVIVLPRAGSTGPVSIRGIAEMSEGDLRPFLGSVPGILTSPKALVTEGHEQSFDTTFYTWVVGDPSVRVVAMGSCSTVLSAAAGAGVWSKLSGQVVIAGVIDRDYRSPEAITQLETSNCPVLDLHEAESYLCMPEVAQALATALGNKAKVATAGDVGDLICEFARLRLERVAATRACARFRRATAPSLANSFWKKGLTRQAVEQALSAAAGVVAAPWGEADLLKAFASEMDELEKAIEARDFKTILQKVPGKELLREMAPLIGCEDAESVCAAAVHHLDVLKLPVLSDLRQRIRRALHL